MCNASYTLFFVFNSPEFGEIRTVTINNEPYFVGKDGAEALGYSNTKDAIISHVDEDERSKLDLGRAGMATFVTESGLYSVILRSDKPNAHAFRKWVTAEVLPSIRKNGGYLERLKCANSFTPVAFILRFLYRLCYNMIKIP